MKEKIELDYLDTKLTPCYGGKQLTIEYTLTHHKNGFKNVYTISAGIGGINDGSIYVDFTGRGVVTDREGNNEETLIDEVVLQMAEDLTNN